MKSAKKRVFTFFYLMIFFLSGICEIPAMAVKRDRISPLAPSSIKSSVVSHNSTKLSWKASKDNVGVKSYIIYKNGVAIGTTSRTTYTVKGLAAGKTYRFLVKAKDKAGNISKGSKTLTITTKKAIPTPRITPKPSKAPVPTQKSTPKPTKVPILSSIPVEESPYRIVGYYAAWSAYSNFTPDKVDASKLTHINYAFANIGSDYRIMLGYPDVDEANFTKLRALKQSNPNLKTLISVGGWTWSGRFSDVALTDASRTVFADSCVDFIIRYGFDGVDIDWEYPVSGGVSTNIKRPEDKQNFTLLMQKIRERLDAREALDGKQYLLTFSGGSSSGYVNNIELSKLALYVDFANVMTYDIHGTWDMYTDFNAPLYRSTDISPQYKWSVDDSIRVWLNTGFPASKLVMGVPFYGYIYNAVGNVNNGLYQTYSGSSSISYENIAGNYLNNSQFIRYFHSESKVPWLFNGTTFITYEDEQSMQLKGEYIKTKGLGGAMIWELSQDPNRILLNSLYNSLK